MDTLIYKCPNCGGALQFDPNTQQYQCDFCRSDFGQQQLDQIDQQNKEKESSAALLYQCPSCGAEIVTDETTAATFCFYCHNPVVLSGRISGQYEPERVIPFSIDRAKATEIFLAWLKKKKYLPKEFCSEEQIEKITGVYFPYWLYRCQVTGKLEANCKKKRVWTTGSTEYTEIKVFDVSREGTMDINNVSRNALKKADKELVDAVLPFELNQLKSFSMGYLSGFFAEKRDLDKDGFVQEVTEEVKGFAMDHLKGSIGAYHEITVRRNETVVEAENWQYVLFPVWTLTYNDKKHDKIYYFACNGQTGKVCGVLPVDHKKLLFLFIAIFIPVFLFLLIVGYLI